MAIKLTLLKSGEMLISDAKELVSDTNTVDSQANHAENISKKHTKNPCIISTIMLLSFF